MAASAPCFRLLREEWDLESGDFGPWDFRPLAREAAFCASVRSGICGFRMARGKGSVAGKWAGNAGILRLFIFPAFVTDAVTWAEWVSTTLLGEELEADPRSCSTEPDYSFRFTRCREP